MKRAMVLSAGVAMLIALTAAAAPAAAGTVTVTKVGSGLVTSDPGGIDCGSQCSASWEGIEDCVFDVELREWICFTEFQRVTLTASVPAGSGWAFSKWSGACGGTVNTCLVSPEVNRAVTATFVDVANPTVSLTAPAAGIKSGSIVLAASASDNAGVTRVEFRVRGALVGTDMTAPYSVPFNTASVAEGSAELRATAFDAAGRSDTTTQTSTIDNLAPALTVATGPNGVTLGPGQVPAWRFGAADAGSGLASVRCSVVRAGAADVFGACSSAQTHSPGSLRDGVYRFAVRARDKAGRETTQRRTFGIDTTGPVITITSGPPEGARLPETTVELGFSANEPASFRCRVFPAALSPGGFGPCTNMRSHVASGFSPGTYAVEVQATDAIGNVGPTVKRTFTVTADGGPVDVGLAYKWAVRGGRTRVRVMTLKRLKAGMTVEVRCTGPGCPFKVRRPAVKRSSLGLARLFGRHKLRKGAVIAVHVSRLGFTTKVFRYVMRKGSKLPKGGALCLPPEELQATAC